MSLLLSDDLSATELLNDPLFTSRSAREIACSQLNTVTDAADELIDALREHPAVVAAAAELSTLGYSLRLVPASLAPNVEEACRISYWLEQQHDEVCVGVTAQLTLAEVLAVVRRASIELL